MKVGIIGDAKRAVAWEQHLRPHRIVREVDLCPNIKDVGQVDACFIIDDSEQNLQILLEGIRQELNCFLISQPPTDINHLQKIHQAANEAGVQVQLSHWPSLAPASQWMMNSMKKPVILDIVRETTYSQLFNSEFDFHQLWIDELGFCLKWMNSGIHNIEAKEVKLDNKQPVFLHIFLRFDNGATANIKINIGAKDNRHIRMATSKQEILECHVREQKIRVGRLNNSGNLYFQKQQFEPAKAAEKAALMFLKAIQMNSETPYTAYDAYLLAVHVEKVKKRLRQFE